MGDGQESSVGTLMKREGWRCLSESRSSGGTEARESAPLVVRRRRLPGGLACCSPREYPHPSTNGIPPPVLYTRLPHQAFSVLFPPPLSSYHLINAIYSRKQMNVHAILYRATLAGSRKLLLLCIYSRKRERYTRESQRVTSENKEKSVQETSVE